jgi:hypothetical protein
MTLARKMAGAYIPANIEILGLITESDDCYCRNWCAAVRNTLTDAVGTMVNGVWRSIDPDIFSNAKYI